MCTAKITKQENPSSSVSADLFFLSLSARIYILSAIFCYSLLTCSFGGRLFLLTAPATRLYRFRSHFFVKPCICSEENQSRPQILFLIKFVPLTQDFCLILLHISVFHRQKTSYGISHHTIGGCFLLSVFSGAVIFRKGYLPTSAENHTQFLSDLGILFLI